MAFLGNPLRTASGVTETTFALTPNLLFDKDYSFGSDSNTQSPANINADFTNARVAQNCYCVINRGAGEPTYGAGIEKSAASITFDPAVNNYMLFTYNGNNKVLLTIFKKA